MPNNFHIVFNLIKQKHVKSALNIVSVSFVLVSILSIFSKQILNKEWQMANPYACLCQIVTSDCF